MDGIFQAVSSIGIGGTIAIVTVKYLLNNQNRQTEFLESMYRDQIQRLIEQQAKTIEALERLTEKIQELTIQIKALIASERERR